MYLFSSGVEQGMHYSLYGLPRSLAMTVIAVFDEA